MRDTAAALQSAVLEAREVHDIITKKQYTANWLREMIVSGDQVVLFTDGMIEAENTDGDMFGSGRIDDELETCLPTAGALLRAILASHALFTAGTTAADDRTLVVVKRT